MTQAAEDGVRIGLSAVVMTLKDRQAVVLTTPTEDGSRALPFGPFDPVRDRTFERALRDFVTAQTGFRLGFVEQLYTFGDAGRASPRATPGPGRHREVSVGYLALTPDAAEGQTHDARWDAVFEFFPWEDRRGGHDAQIAEGLHAWADDDEHRLARARALFALTPDHRWNEERVLERYELLYEARLVAEAWRDADLSPTQPMPGRIMSSDHRRILATALGRLRSKLKYRPVLFDLTPCVFTLSELQAGAEAVSGLSLHKQNFRRGVERTGLVEATGQLSSTTGGRPAELFRFKGVDAQTGAAPGLSLPAQR
ncbi:NrtR DNA-binding winged helix domain-containing protein [Brevundimonas vesicularis]|uniref:NUDIX hydrolase n=1 Tax=Brevundimonas vesicularis TaxID=41276 RepID=UPI00384FE47E